LITVPQAPTSRNCFFILFPAFFMEKGKLASSSWKCCCVKASRTSERSMEVAHGRCRRRLTHASSELKILSMLKCFATTKKENVSASSRHQRRKRMATLRSLDNVPLRKDMAKFELLVDEAFAINNGSDKV